MERSPTPPTTNTSSSGSNNPIIRNHPKPPSSLQSNNDNNDGNSDSDNNMILSLPKGTIQYRWKVVSYIGIIVIVFFVFSIVLLIVSYMNHHTNHNKDSTTSKSDTTTSTSTYEYNGITITMEMKHQLYNQYRTLIINELSLQQQPTGSSSSSNDNDNNNKYYYYNDNNIYNIEQLLVQPSSSEYKALQYIFMYYDTIVLDLLLVSLSTTSISSDTIRIALVQRFAIYVIYIHLQIIIPSSLLLSNPTTSNTKKDNQNHNQNLFLHIHECQWPGVTCTNNNDDNTSNMRITGINITSLLLSMDGMEPMDDTTSTVLVSSNTTLPKNTNIKDGSSSSSSSGSSSTTTTTTTILYGTTIPTALCYVSTILQILDLSNLQLIGTIPLYCYISYYWDNIHTIHIQNNELKQFFTIPIDNNDDNDIQNSNNYLPPLPTMWWPKIRSINVANNLLHESIISSSSLSSWDDVQNNNNNNNNNNQTKYNPNDSSINTSNVQQQQQQQQYNNNNNAAISSILYWKELQYLNVQGNHELYGPLFEHGFAAQDLDNDDDRKNNINTTTMMNSTNDSTVNSSSNTIISMIAWPNIEVLEISETSISGTIPDHPSILLLQTEDENNNNNVTTTSINPFSKLVSFSAYRVPLSGSLPNMLGIATNLQLLALGLSDQIWTGTLPESYSNLSLLKDLSLSYLNGITGTLPVSWGYHMNHIESIDLFSNPDLSGTIPSSWGNMTNISILRFGQTGISGTIPSELGTLTNLVEVSFHRTKLMGSVPSEICSLRTDYILKKLSVDCNANNLGYNQTAMVTCSFPDCCTTCT